MTENELQLVDFNTYMELHYTEYLRKMKQWCFLNHLTFDEDVYQDTYIKIADLIKRKGLKAKTEQDYLNYFFQSFKFNTYQQKLKEQKSMVDDNITLQDVLLFDDEDYSEDRYYFIDCVKRYLDTKINENFDYLTYSIWRLRYLVEINGKTLNYKEIKKLTQVKDVRKRIMGVNQYIRDNITIAQIKEAIKNKEIF